MIRSPMLDYHSNSDPPSPAPTLVPKIRLFIAVVVYVLSMVSVVCWTKASPPGPTVIPVRGYKFAIGDIREWPDEIRWGRFNYRKVLFSAPTINALFVVTALLDLTALLMFSPTHLIAKVARWMAVVAFGYACASALLLSAVIVFVGSKALGNASFNGIGFAMPLWLLAFIIQIFCRSDRRSTGFKGAVSPPEATFSN